MLGEITPVILTLNEQQNIARTLNFLKWANEVVVVDSGSTDDTTIIVGEFDNARVLYRKFDNHARQWNFAIQESQIRTPWILALDADYRLTDAFVEELSALSPESRVTGYRASFIYCINGKPLRGSLYPPVTVLFRRDHGVYVQDGHTQRIQLSGSQNQLRSVVYHDDRKSFSQWLQAQKKYAALEAATLASSSFLNIGWPDKLRKLIVIAPVLVPLYVLFVNGTAVNGIAGFKYAAQRMIAEIMLSSKLLKNKIL